MILSYIQEAYPSRSKSGKAVSLTKSCAAHTGVCLIGTTHHSTEISFSVSHIRHFFSPTIFCLSLSSRISRLVSSSCSAYWSRCSACRSGPRVGLHHVRGGLGSAGYCGHCVRPCCSTRWSWSGSIIFTGDWAGQGRQ